MAYDEGLAQRLREALEGTPGIVEKKMFGGLGFILAGNMAIGVSGDELMVRTGPDRFEEALAQPGAAIFDMAGRPMKGWITVAPEGVADDMALERWVEMGLAAARSLPPK